MFVCQMNLSTLFFTLTILTLALLSVTIWNDPNKNIASYKLNELKNDNIIRGGDSHSGRVLTENDYYENSKARTELQPRETTTSGIKKVYEIVYFGGSIRKMDQMQIDQFEMTMKNYSMGIFNNSNPPSHEGVMVSTSCSLTFQGPVRKRRERPPHIYSHKERRDKNKARQQTQKRRLVDDIIYSNPSSIRKGKSFLKGNINQQLIITDDRNDNYHTRRNLEECDTASNTASLTIHFTVEWSANTTGVEDVLECYESLYESYMNSQDGKNSMLNSLNQLTFCANSAKGFNGTSTSYACDVTSAPTTATSTIAPTISMTNATYSIAPTMSMTNATYSIAPTMSMTNATYSIAPSPILSMNTSHTYTFQPTNNTSEPKESSTESEPVSFTSSDSFTLLPTNSTLTIMPTSNNETQIPSSPVEVNPTLGSVSSSNSVSESGSLPPK